MYEYTHFGAAVILAVLFMVAVARGGSGRKSSSTEARWVLVNASAPVWANNALINTQVTVTFDLQDPRSSVIKIQVHNPSTVTALTVEVRDMFEDQDGATDRFGLLTSFGVGANTTASKIVDLAGGSGPAINAAPTVIAPRIRIILSNDTALGAADGFTATMKVTSPNFIYVAS